MSKKLNASVGFHLGLELGPKIEALTKYPEILREVHALIHEIEARKVATYNRRMGPDDKAAAVTQLQVESSAGKGQGDA